MLRNSETYELIATRPIVSVIIPIYNSEKWICESLDCLVNQTLQNIEIICIDDGSTDNSAALIKHYCNKDSRIKYYWQENSGAGVARNKGISIAEGKYLSFLDADDLYDPYMLEAMSDALEISDAEICMCRAERFDSQTGKRWDYYTFPKKYENGIYETTDLQAILFQISLVPWNKLYLRSFIITNNIQYQNITWTNDLYFVSCALALSTSIYILNESYVSYRYNTGQSIQDKKSSQPLCGVEAWYAVRERLIQQNVLTNYGRRSMDKQCFDAFYNYFRRFVNDPDASSTIYDQLKYKLLTELQLNEDPFRYFSLTKSIKLWCIQRTSLKGLRWACQPIGTGKRYYGKLASMWTNIRLIIAGIFYRDKQRTKAKTF